MKTPVSLSVKNAPDADFDYGRVKDETSAGAADGTAIAADIIDNIWYALLAVIKAAGVTPSETTENTNGVNDFLDALNALLVGILIDEDDMVSNSAVLAPTQQSVKAYIGSRGVQQQVYAQNGAYAAVTGNIPADDTIPQITEGTQVLSCAITPRSATSTLRIDVTVNFGGNAQPSACAALFRDAVADALAVGTHSPGDDSTMNSIQFTHFVSSTATSSTTFTVRLGWSSGSGGFNGSGGGRKYGGVCASSISITEIVI
jgi:hypothetical protein